MVRPSYNPQTAYVRARVDGLVSGYFEWMGAASYTSDQRTSAMHGKQFLLDAVFAGLDADSVSGRLDFQHSVPEGAYRLVVNFEVRRDEHDRKSPMESYRLAVDAQGHTLQKWVLSNGEEQHKLASFSSDDGNSSTPMALRWRCRDFRIPRSLRPDWRAAGKPHSLAVRHLARSLAGGLVAAGGLDRSVCGSSGRSWRTISTAFHRTTNSVTLIKSTLTLSHTLIESLCQTEEVNR